ncbi:MAG: S9 family peptidase [Symbiobacteriaceae bacterium]|nr:S9 family peptidase [Symbiobacteriaceae bacterium]
MSQKTFGVDDVLKLKNFGMFQLSPDATLVAFEVREQDLESDESKTNLWWVATCGSGEAKQITSSGKDNSPNWSHDSSKLAFVSSRSGKGQLYIMDRFGGEAQMLKTDCRPGGGSLQWSPDDRFIAFTASKEIEISTERYPGEPEELWQSAAKELAGRAKQDSSRPDERRKTAPVRVITNAEYRFDGRGMTYENLAQLFVLDVQEGTCTQMTQQGGGLAPSIAGYTWYQGESLIFASSDTDLEGIRGSVFYSIAKGEEAQELFHFPGGVNNLTYSPEHDALIFSGSYGARPQGTAPNEVWLWRPGRSQAISLTADLDRSCREVTWEPVSNTIYYIKDDRGTGQLYQRQLLGDKLSAQSFISTGDLSHVAALSMAQDGTLAYTASNVQTLPQIYVLSGDAAKPNRRLTANNPNYLEEGLFCEAETLSFQSQDGWQVEGFLMRPHGYQEGSQVPAVLCIHGGPTGAYYRNFAAECQLYAHAGYAVIYINPRGSTTYGTKFAEGVNDDWGGGDYADIMAGVDAAIATGVVDPNKIGVTGWSYGGYMTCWVVTQTNRFKAAIGGANVINIYTQYGTCDIGPTYVKSLMGGKHAFDHEESYMSQSSIRYVRNVTTPIMLLHGEADLRCPISHSEQFYTALKRMDKDVVFVRYPEQWHGLAKPTYVKDRWLRSLAWFNHYLV